MKKGILFIILFILITLSCIHAENTTDDIETQPDMIKDIDNENTFITVTNSNYNEYFDQFDATTTDKIQENSTVLLSGNFKNKEFVIDKKGIGLIGNNNTILQNSAILILQTAGNNTIQKLTINNENTLEYAIFNEANNVHIQLNNLTVINDNRLSQPIYNIGNYTTINNNIIHVEGSATDIDWNNGPRCGLANTIGILNENTYSTIVENNSITATKSKFGENEHMGTISGIENKGGEDIIINDNNVTVSGARFCYAINALNQINNVQITRNNICITGERYVDGIQIGNNAYNSIIENNTITGNCYNTTILTAIDDEAMAFGIITTSMGGGKSENMTIQNNKITLNSTICYGLEIYSTHNSNYKQNNITLTGLYTMGIAIARSPNNNITQNNIIANGNTNTRIHEITEEIRPATMAIRMQQNSDNITITGNYFIITDKKENNIVIDVNSCNNTLIDENIISINNNGGNNVIKLRNNTNATIKNNYNKKETKLMVNTQINNNKITIIATIQISDNNINQGKISFKVNGKTLKDDEGKVIYVKVINKTALVENYKILDTWNENTTIQATYSGSTQCTKLTSDNTNLNITPKELTLITRDVTATVCTIINITAELNDNTINKGKIVFKINGKTLKDDEGKVIYSKVINGTVNIEYYISDSMKHNEYNINIVYIPIKGFQLESNVILRVIN